MPRPTRENRRIAYLTNMYTRPGHRGQGIGTEILRHAQQAAKDASVELIIVWPSDDSIDFYKCEGFTDPDEPLIWNAD